MSQPLPVFGDVLGGRFQIVRSLGQGGMGAVFEAENLVTRKHVAIKWMRPQAPDSSDTAQRFAREAQAAARVRHPNVVDIYDVVQEQDVVFLIMELLDGEPLSTWLARGGMPLPGLVALLLPAMHGVAAAHKQGVIHRDVKPDNIFLARQADRTEPCAKVLDFGISKLQEEGGMMLTRTGTALGTPLYMSFEQVLGEKDLDGRVDVYSFGVILYEAATGKPPFEASTLTDLAVKMATQTPSAPKLLRPELPTTLDALIQRAMAGNARSARVPWTSSFVSSSPLRPRTRFAPRWICQAIRCLWC